MSEPSHILMIQSEMARQSMNQTQLAQRLGVSHQHVSDILSGKRRLTHKLAHNLELVLGLNAMKLMVAQIDSEGRVERARLGHDEYSDRLAAYIDKSKEVLAAIKTINGRYAHRNGQTDYPREPGHYWTEHPVSHELSTTKIDQHDIEFADKVNAMPTTIHKIGGYYRYYGPIPEPDVSLAESRPNEYTHHDPSD